ncbi:MAG TPA: hypothetical protein VG992_04200 [Candidatus Saccharimonadales bacterium]|nr:hypothetical protein [Candidatus Saccharimonadales bacterium]
METLPDHPEFQHLSLADVGPPSERAVDTVLEHIDRLTPIVGLTPLVDPERPTVYCAPTRFEHIAGCTIIAVVLLIERHIEDVELVTAWNIYQADAQRTISRDMTLLSGLPEPTEETRLHEERAWELERQMGLAAVAQYEVDDLIALLSRVESC